MTSGRAAIASMCGGLLIVAGLLWWQSALEVTSSPRKESKPTIAGAENPTKEAETLEGKGKHLDSDREQLASRPLETPPAETANGSLLLLVVYGDDNTPVAGIGVVVHEVSAQGRWGLRRRFTTSDKGRVRVADLRPGHVHVRTDRQPTKGEMAMVVAGEETRFTLTLKEGIDVNGMVVDTDGVGVADAEIIVTGWLDLKPHVAARSDAGGRFGLRQVPPKCNVGARAPGYAPSPLQMITAAAGAKVDVRIVLPGPGGGVRGRVLDPDGNGVAEVLVKMGPLEPDRSIINLPDGSRGMKPRAAESRTDAEGRFEVTGLAPGKTPVLARAKTFAPWVGCVDVVAHVTTPLVIRLQPGVTCEGTVYDDQGKPAARVEVNHGAYGAPDRRNTRTAADGSYRLEGLPTGRILVEARGKKRGNASVELNGLPGQTLRWDAKLLRGRQLELLVLDQANNPLPHVIVMAIGPHVKGKSPRFHHGFTDKDGKFALTDCPAAGLRILELRKPEYVTLRRFDVDTSVGRMVLRMEYEGKPTARIVGTILDPDGKPVANADLGPIRRGDPNTRGYATTAAGKIDIRELRPGSYQLLVRAGGYPKYMSPEHTLANGETWDVGTIQLVRGACVKVQVANAAEVAKVTKHVYLTVCTKDGASAAYVDTRQLPLRSAPVPPGKYVLSVSGPKVIPQTIPISVSESQDTEVQVSIKIGIPRVFQFVLPDGNDKTYRMDVSLVGGEGVRFKRQLDRVRPDRYRLKVGLAPGRYKMEARTGKEHKGELEFDVSAERTAVTEKTIRVKLY